MNYNTSVVKYLKFNKKERYRMGVIVHKEQERNTELSRKIAADLKIKAEQSASSPDLVDESDYLANSKTTGRYSWFWLILVGLAILALVLIVII